MPHSDVKVTEYFSDLSCAGTVTGNASIAPVCCASRTRSRRGSSARDEMRYVVSVRRICCTSVMLVPPSSSSMPRMILPVGVSETFGRGKLRPKKPFGGRNKNFTGIFSKSYSAITMCLCLPTSRS